VLIKPHSACDAIHYDADSLFHYLLINLSFLKTHNIEKNNVRSLNKIFPVFAQNHVLKRWIVDQRPVKLCFYWQKEFLM